MTEGPEARVFVSYSWTSADHIQWVVDLCERLVSDGVDVVLDQWELREGQDKYAFMERMVVDSTVTRVLVISDSEYQSKADARKGGVGTESQIISKSVYEKVDETKFVPIVAEWDERGKPCLPVYLGNRIYVDLADPDTFPAQYEQLLRAIYERPARTRPPMGKPPAHLMGDSTVGVASSSLGESKVVLADIERNARGFPLSFRRYLDCLPAALEEVRPSYEDVEADPPFDQRIVDSIEAFTPARDGFLKVVSMLSDFGADERYFVDMQETVGELYRFTERPPDIGSFNDVWWDNYKFILYELFLHSIAILKRGRHWDLIDLFLDSPYFYEGPNGPSETDYTGFVPYVRCLDEVRKARLQLRLISVTADLLIERATNKAGIDDLVETDILLFLRSWLAGAGRFSAWFPRTVPYARHRSPTGLQLFYRAASSDRYFGYLRRALKIDSAEDLRAKCEAAHANAPLHQFHSRHRLTGVHLLANLKGLCGWEPS